MRNLFFILFIPVFFISCGNDDSTYSPVLKGSEKWYLQGTSILALEMEDPNMYNAVENYMTNYRKCVEYGYAEESESFLPYSGYYYHFSKEEYSFMSSEYLCSPLHITGKYSTYGNNIQFDDETKRAVVSKNALIVTIDMRNRIAEALDIDIDKIKKAVLEERYGKDGDIRY